MNQTEKQLERRQKREKLEAKKEEEQKRKNLDHAGFINRKRRNEKADARKKLHNREIDYSIMRTIRIDNKTWVYLEPGDDEKKIRQRYEKLTYQAKTLMY